MAVKSFTVKAPQIRAIQCELSYWSVIVTHKYINQFTSNKPFMQGILTEGEESVQLTSLFRSALLLTVKGIFFLFPKQAILMRRSTVLILPLREGFPGLCIFYPYHVWSYMSILNILLFTFTLTQGSLCTFKMIYLTYWFAYLCQFNLSWVS